MYKNRDWFVLAPIGVLALALAYWGFSQCAGVDCKHDSAWNILQRSFGLLRGAGNFTLDKDPWQLVVAQYLVPAVALFAAGKLFLVNLRRDMRVALARKSRNHTIVCGLGETGRQVVDNLCKVGERVVAIDLDIDKPNAVSCEHAGVPVIKGDAKTLQTLQLAGIGRARALVAATESDSTNLEIALRASEARAGNRASRLLVLPQFRTSTLIGGVTGHRRATLGSAAEIRPFATHQIAARLLYRSSAWAQHSRASAQKVPHVIIVGLGAVGSEVLAQGIRTHFALPGGVPRFTVIDQAGEAADGAFFAENPGAREVADIDFLATTVSNMTLGHDIKLPEGDAGPTAIVIALPDDDTNLALGMRFRNRLDELKLLTTPIFVRLRGRHKLGEFAARLERLGPLRHRLVPFGDLAVSTDVAILFEQGLDRIARAYHEAYLQTVAPVADAMRSPAALPWEELPELYRQSSRRFADHVAVNVHAAGLRLHSAKTPRRLVLDDAEIERLAANEHWRWTVERRMAGWVHGATRDDLRRIHPLLVPWQTLSAAVQEQNRNAIRGLPGILADAGLELRRERIVSAVKADSAAATEAIGRHAGGDNDEHLVVIVDPEDAASCEVGKRAVHARHASIWLLLSQGVAGSLGQSLARLEPSRDLWDHVENWIDGEAFAALRAGAVGVTSPRVAAST